jgi:hypothetical protein
MGANSMDVAAGAEPPNGANPYLCPGARAEQAPPLHQVREPLGHAAVNLLLLLRLG